MSAINIIVQRDAAHMITDGARYFATGELGAVAPKCYALPHLPALITLRGAGALGLIVENLSCKFASFDALVDGIEVALAKIVEDHGHLWQHCGQTLIELMFVGWSEQHNRFVSYLIRTEEANDGTIEITEGVFTKVDTVPFTLTELPVAVLAPALSDDMLKMVGLKLSGVEQFNPIIDGRRLLEAQRALKVSLNVGDPPACYCGGFAMLSTVTRTGITQRVFHRWPDKVGEMLNQNPITDWPAWCAAFAAEQVAEVVTDGLSPLKRRMLEKKAKKGTLRAAVG